MLRFLVGLFALVLSAQVIVVRHRGAPEGEPWLEGYAYRKELTIPAGAVTGDLTNFPVYVSLAGDADLAAHAQPDGSDIVFTADDKVTVLPFEVPRSPKTMLVADGAWNWCADPRAVRVGNKTFVGVVTSTGYIYVVSYDHVTKQATSSGSLYSAGQLEVDDHDNPVFLILSDGKIAAFYQRHNGSAYYRITTNAGDVSAWGPERDWTAIGGNHAYLHPFRLTGESNKIYAFFRGSATYELLFATTTEANLAAGTWNAAQKWIDTGHQFPYAKFCSNNTDTIFAAFTDMHPKDGESNLYFAKHFNGKWYKANGTEVGNDAALPMALASVEKVKDASEHGRTWIWDIALDADGHPVIAYTVYPDGTGSSVRYRYLRWTGAAWADHEICAGGSGLYPVEQFYSGGIVLDHSNPNIVYLSRNNSTGGNYILEKWTTADNGATWTSTLIADGGVMNVRPAFAWGASTDDPLSLVWMTGSYTTYTNYATSIVTSPALSVPRLNWLQDAVVKIPSVTAAGGAKVYLYYGRSNPPDLSDAANVWSGAQFAVHGNDYDLGDAVLDSKSVAPKYKFKLPTSAEGAGKIGRAQAFPNSGQIRLGTFNLASRRTLSIMGWVKGANGYIISNLGSDTSKAGMYLRVHPTSHKLDMWMRDSAGAAISGVFEPVVFDADTWHHIAVVFDADNGGWKAWIDGVQSPTVRSSQAFAEKASDSWDLGYCAFANQSFNGSLDELRLYPGALTEAEIKADYAAGVGTLVQVGAEEVR